VQRTYGGDAGDRIEPKPVAFIYAIAWSAVDITVLSLLRGVLWLKVTMHTLSILTYLPEIHQDAFVSDVHCDILVHTP
jgi:hypothetical protein